MNKLYDLITWNNGTTPAINEDNLNAMSTAIDNIDDRVIALGGDLLEVIPQIQAYLEQADDLVEVMETLSKNPPYIGANGNWFVWDTNTSSFVDSGIDASITVAIQDITMLAPDATPYVTNTGTNTDPVFHLFIPRGQTGATGPTGATPDISMTATTDATSSSTPTVTITESGTAENPSFALAFSGLKGPQGETGATGATGPTGNGIASIAKTSTSGNVDTYTITFTNGDTTTFTVTNGVSALSQLSDVDLSQYLYSGQFLKLQYKNGQYVWTNDIPPYYGGSIVEVHTTNSALDNQELVLTDGINTERAIFADAGNEYIAIFEYTSLSGDITATAEDGNGNTYTGHFTIAYYGNYVFDFPGDNPKMGALEGLSDVTISSPSNGQVLKYNSTTQKWENGTGGGGGSSTLSGLDDVTMTTPSDGQVLSYSNSLSKWINKSIPQINDSATSASGLWSSDKINTELSDKADASDLPTWSSAVACAAGATSCTITDAAIATTSIIEPFCDSSTPIPFDSITVTTGQAVIAFDALEAATNFKVRITN